MTHNTSQRLFMLTFQTERLSIAPLVKEEVPWMHVLHAYPEVARYNTIGVSKGLADMEKLFRPYFEGLEKDDPRMWECTVRDGTGEIIGLVGMTLASPRYRKAEIHYNLHPKAWGKGYMSEAVLGLLDFGFGEWDLHRIEAGVHVENVRSIKLLERVGMVREGRHREILPVRGAWADNYTYAILERDWKGQG